jgi:hypothetical protein
MPVIEESNNPHSCINVAVGVMMTRAPTTPRFTLPSSGRRGETMVALRATHAKAERELR